MSREFARPQPAEIVDRRALAPQGPDTRDNLTMRSKRMHEAYPRALDFERDVLDAVRPMLAGVGSILCGTHDADYFRDMLLGNRQSLPLYDLCRLALSERPEAGAAVDALLTVLARQRGLVLSPAETTTVEAHEALAAFAGAAGALIENMTRDLRDNHIDRAEAADRLPQLRRLKACVSVLETLIETAQRMPERNGR